jgi:hypothetical protein
MAGKWNVTQSARPEICGVFVALFARNHYFVIVICAGPKRVAEMQAEQ